MGAYFTRNRAWCYVAFYDDYCGRHINTSAGLACLFAIPLYLYGIHVNRTAEVNFRNFYYNWTHFDKRNRLTHNIIMEHFEVHTEQLEDLMVEMDKVGPKALAPAEGFEPKWDEAITMDDLALIDELAGLNEFWDNIFLHRNVPVALR
eukprot:NODE_5273_length_589_cov_63.700000_g4565_i0.p1 GENE.NODE_5273_length_589_cov_63.700000_g4565_i0~~NODE_5273_length_589_cov_63.700000_g4565_i0.p1  ORF type:complete len:158 (-),score=24.60 NODE_5273_length_589_cov_63.700000_g4565_i0:116-559(-)